MSKKLVAYFSASGVTKKVAAELAKVEQADLFEIKPVELYTADDLNYMNKTSRSSVEMGDLNCRPAMAETVADMAQYDVVYIGFPIWWGREPSIVDTFLESADFSGKKIIPFCTSGGSSIGKTCERINALTGGKANVETGARHGGDISEEDLKIWTEGL